MSIDLVEEARRRLEAGHPASARSLAEHALSVARPAKAQAAIAGAARILGECLYVIGEVDGARALADEAHAIDVERGDAPGLGADLNLVGILELTIGRTDESIALLRQSYDVRAEALGPDDPDTIESLNNMAVALWRSGAHDQAIGLHEEALRRCDRALGDGHRRTAETLNALAVKLEARTETQARARATYERGLEVAQAALGPDSDLVARLLTNVATARMNDGDLATAGPMIERALELHELHFGPMSRWTSYVLMSQGEHAWLEDRFPDARRAFERAFVIRVNELGPTDPEALDAATSLLNVLSEVAGQARLAKEGGLAPNAEADDAMAEATALYLPVAALRPSPDDPFAASMSPDPERAADQLRHVAARIAQRTAPDPAQAAAIAHASQLTDEADAAYLAGDIATADDGLSEAIGLLEAARGPTHTSLVEPLHRLALVRQVGGMESQVLPILERIAAILTDAYGEVHPLAIQALGHVYWQERREFGPAGGRETAERIQALAGATLGEASPVWQLLRDVIASAQDAVSSGTEPDSEPLSVRRERMLEMGSPLADELLGDLDHTPWSSLDHAYGRAMDTPRHIRSLLADDDRVRDDALDLLGESLLHQETVYPATAPAVAWVRRLVGEQRVPGRERLVPFLAAAGVAARDASGDAADDLRRTLADLPMLLSRLATSDDDATVRKAASFALTVIGQPPSSMPPASS